MIKTHNSNRSLMASHLAESIREDWGWDGLILLMSGAPAPKNPTDFWHQCEVVQPGYLREGSFQKFTNRLGLVIKEESFAGGSYPKLVTWWDNDKKCAKCGQLEHFDQHVNAVSQHFHRFEKSVNEVDLLYQRMQGLVIVLRKKDILPELPDKVYEEIKLEPDRATIRRARLIARGSKTTIEALTNLRELSDGIKYETVESQDQYETCERCHGAKEATEYIGTDPMKVVCPNCEGSGVQKKQVRQTTFVPTPKDQALRELLDRNEDQGRLVVFAGFRASILRIVKVCQDQGWDTIRVDGTTKNLRYQAATSWTALRDPIEEFQDQNSDKRKLVFIAHPKTAKAGITLTRACMIVYYSNTFDGDDRIQSEDRIHRIGMDVNKGATIVDLIHLDSDAYVLNNLKQKVRLQDISLGELQRTLGVAE